MSDKRIGTLQAFLLVGLALIFDGIQFLLTVTVIGTVFSWFVGALAWIIFLVWFALLGVNYFGRGAAQKILITMSSVIVELLPFINALPGLTLGVVALIVQNRVQIGKDRNLPHNPENVKALLSRSSARWAASNMREAGRIARAARVRNQSEEQG